MAEPIQSQPGYPPQGQPGYPPQGQPGYPPQGQPGYPPQGQPVSHTVTVVQTAPAMYPPDHCVLSWFACLCCFWPVGICAIINSSNARDAINRGDLASANNYSQTAKKYAMIAIVVGICVILLSIILRVALVSSSSSSSSSYN
ncbi:proline-rich transmembrane protein 1-like [Actinia tenebrosa]|uniref:Proline-rich transmembrane protein 1-like n=1 Tax=Actinia tenebrosa TaxID=6105 RepID=A0A6P8ILH9_ACTTE|nr:proline-rich transmembrane protein 1-like [Actinia tenebrosa]XP_031567664.1 proline-rich transmembrane protein 1-like [Actinia tenebrosa]